VNNEYLPVYLAINAFVAGFTGCMLITNQCGTRRANGCLAFIATVAGATAATVCLMR
jgi:hypothetical protein